MVVTVVVMRQRSHARIERRVFQRLRSANMVATYLGVCFHYGGTLATYRREDYEMRSHHEARVLVVCLSPRTQTQSTLATYRRSMLPLYSQNSHYFQNMLLRSRTR